MSFSALDHGARVAVIGAGAAGLAAARALREKGFAVTIYERSGELGGTWNYGGLSDSNCSLYENLHCNLPKQIMGFRGIPLESVRSFPGHADVHKYLLDYAQQFRLRELIQFYSTVTWATPGRSPRKLNITSWDLTIERRFGNNERTIEHATFDALVIANGHYSVPNPWLPAGADVFSIASRTIVHSHLYRNAKPFEKRRVVVVGAGPSGTDIALELARSGAKEVYLSHRNGKGKTHYAGIVPQVPALDALTSDGTALFSDGSTLSGIDDVLLCTGYRYDLRFLDPKCGVYVQPDGRRIRGLISHCIGASNHSISIVGVPWKVIPFPLFEDQANFIAAVLSGRVDSAKLAEILAKEKEEDFHLGTEDKYHHMLDDRQWEYRRRLADLSGTKPPSQSSIEVYCDSKAARFIDPGSYKKREYIVFGDGSGDWRVFDEGDDVTGALDPGAQAFSELSVH